jgi:hypothetical protein
MNSTASRSRTHFITVALLVIAGCVSVKLAGTGDTSKRAVGVQFNEPGSPFDREQREGLDGAWKNPKNGNMISYLSDCQDSSDPSLDTIVQNAVAGLSELKFDSTQSPTVQGREARRVVASGKVDGVASKIDMLAFKRNRCIYIVTYVGVAKVFDENHGQFDKFLSGFRAP